MKTLISVILITFSLNLFAFGGGDGGSGGGGGCHNMMTPAMMFGEDGFDSNVLFSSSPEMIGAIKSHDLERTIDNFNNGTRITSSNYKDYIKDDNEDISSLFKTWDEY